MYSTFVFLPLSPSDELSNKNLKINKLKLNPLSTITFKFFFSDLPPLRHFCTTWWLKFLLNKLICNSIILTNLFKNKVVIPLYKRTYVLIQPVSSHLIYDMAKLPLTLIISLSRLIPSLLHKSLYSTDLFINMVIRAGGYKN